MVLTRWNAVFLAFKRMNRIAKRAFQLFSLEWNENTKNSNTKVELLSEEEWILLRETVELLEPLYDATVEISGETFTTLSKVIPMSTQLMAIYSESDKTMTQTTCDFKLELVKSLKKRFGSFENNEAYVCATMLDPNHKNVAFGIDPYRISSY